MKLNTWILAFAISVLICTPIFVLYKVTLKNDPRSRPDVRDGELVASHTMIENCDYIVFKHPHGEMWDVVGVVHDPKCKNCNPPTIVE